MLKEVMGKKNKGDNLRLSVARQQSVSVVDMELGEKKERSFPITPMASPDQLQTAILKTWFRETVQEK